MLFGGKYLFRFFWENVEIYCELNIKFILDSLYILFYLIMVIILWSKCYYFLKNKILSCREIISKFKIGNWRVKNFSLCSGINMN